MNWRIKIVIAAWLMAAIVGVVVVWKHLPFDSWVLLPFCLLLFSGTYFLVREARRQSR